MRNAFFLLLFLVPALAFGQSRQQQTDSVVALIRTYFNQKNADKLYELTGEQFKKALTAEQFREIGNRNLFPLGEMPLPQWVSNNNGLSKYKLDFNGTVLGMYVMLDDANKLQTFLFREFVDETQKKTKAATNNPLASDLDKQVDKAVQPYISLAAATGLSIGILKNGQTYFYGYGETEKGNGRLPQANTIFEIGSISKTFTAILLADAVNNGRIRLDDPVSKYLPDSISPLQFGGTAVTIGMLSNHTSAIPRMPENFDQYVRDPLNPYLQYGERQLLSFYKHLSLTRKPGSQYEYSNLAVATLGMILGKMYKKDFEQLVREKITGPLKMDDTRQRLGKTDSARFAKGYNEQGKYNGQWDFQVFAPAGALRSTARDMLLYARANLGEAPAALLKAIQLTHRKTFTDGKNTTALGWHYIRPGADEVLFHNGGTGGYRSYLAMHPSKKFAVVILSNTAIGTEGIGTALMKWLEQNVN